MSIAPILPSPGFGVTPGFGLNLAYGVSANPPRTEVGLDAGRTGITTFGQVLADRIAATGPAASAAGVTASAAPGAAFGLPAVQSPGLVDPADSVGAAASARQGAGAGMGDFVSGKLGELAGLHARSDRLAVAAATGDLQDVHEYTIAANEAGVATQLAVSVRDKALQAFNDIIRMQL